MDFIMESKNFTIYKTKNEKLFKRYRFNIVF